MATMDKHAQEGRMQGNKPQHAKPEADMEQGRHDTAMKKDSGNKPMRREPDHKSGNDNAAQGKRANGAKDGNGDHERRSSKDSDPDMSRRAAGHTPGNRDNAMEPRGDTNKDGDPDTSRRASEHKPGDPDREMEPRGGKSDHRH